MPLCCAQPGLPQFECANARIYLVLGHIDADDNNLDFVPSSTPFLARSGLEALATVRVEEDTGAVPRSDTGSVAFGRNGLSSSNGRLVRNRPFAHSDRFPGHKGAGKTGCALHPRSRVRFAQTKVHTSIQGSGNTPAFPAQGSQLA